MERVVNVQEIDGIKIWNIVDVPIGSMETAAKSWNITNSYIKKYSYAIAIRLCKAEKNERLHELSNYHQAEIYELIGMITLKLIEYGIA